MKVQILHGLIKNGMKRVVRERKKPKKEKEQKSKKEKEQEEEPKKDVK